MAKHTVNRKGARTYKRKNRGRTARNVARDPFLDRVFKRIREWRNGPEPDKWERAQLRKLEMAEAKAKNPQTRKRTTKKEEIPQKYICGRCVIGTYDLQAHNEMYHGGAHK